MGPYARAIHVVLINGEISERKRADKLKQGIENGAKGPHGMFSQSFLLFRGVLLPHVWLKDWTSQEGGDFVRMPTLTSSSQSIEIALQFSQVKEQTVETTKKSVIFVFLIRNYEGFYGFRLSDERYSAFPAEKEFLLMEGFDVLIINVDNDYVIENKVPGLEAYNSKKVTIVYLYNYMEDSTE